jgi:hypothetical protein
MPLWVRCLANERRPSSSGHARSQREARIALRSSIGKV